MAKHLEKKSLKTFLCHSHSDRVAVHALWSRLKKDGVDVWLDRENLQPGQDWEREIRKAILKSHIIIVCLSRGFNKQKGFRHEELKIALQKADVILDDKIFIIPVRLEECNMPDSLCHLHRVDLFERGGYEKLLHALWRHVEAK